MKRTLIHRYDNKLDVLDVESRGYSDVYTEVPESDFEILIVVPTNDAKSELAVYGNARSPQYPPPGGEPWSGRDDKYAVRVDIENVRYTTRDKVREAVERAGGTWAAQWPGRGFIHIYHLRPLSQIGERYEVDPLNDLRPVCPNCHTVIHMKSPPYTIKEFREMFSRDV